MTNENNSFRRRVGVIGLAAMAAWTVATLLPSGTTAWARPLFYRAFLSFASSGKIPQTCQVVAIDPNSAAEALAELAQARPALVALDPDLCGGNAEKLSGLLTALTGAPTVVGIPAAPDDGDNPVPASESASGMPRLPTLEGTLVSPALTRLRAAEGFSLPAGTAGVTAGFVAQGVSPLFTAQVVARGPDGVMTSLALEVLRRSRGLAPTQIAFVDGIGLLVGKQITWPMSEDGRVPLRFLNAPPLAANRLGDAGIRSSLGGKIVFAASARNSVSTVAGTRLAAETWAATVDEALAGVTPRQSGSGGWLSLALGLGGAAALAMCFFFGMGPLGIAGWAAGLSLFFPAASLLLFATAGWWLPPERSFFAVLGAGVLAFIFRSVGGQAGNPPAERPSSSAFPKTPTAKIPTSATPAAAGGMPRSTTRLRAQPSAPEAGGTDPGIERDAQGGLLRVGRYRILRKMGAGSAGEVFEGIDTQMSRRVAIKTMTRGAALHFDHALERFHIEAKAAGSLNHPNINTIYDSGSAREVSYMVLEYLDGITLSQWMRAHAPTPPSPPSVREWIRQIASALDYAHSHRVIHRDLKPSNLMVVDEGRTIKLLDFGVAKVEDVMLTQAGMTVGTPSYMSPEQLQGEKVHAASDQYSLAVVLYQLFSYRLPYAGSRIPEICSRILKNEIIPLHEANPYLDEAHWWVLQRAMRRDPADRYPNCTALFEALELIWTRPSSR